MGLTAARTASEKSLKVLVVEKREKIGFPNHCSGLVSKKFASKYEEAKETILNGIKGAVMSVNKTQLSFKAKKDRAFVIDREAFDRLLAKKAEKTGVKILTGISPSFFEETKNGFEIALSDGKTVAGRYVLVASGAMSGVTRMFGFNTKPSEVIRTFQADMEASVPDTEVVYMFVNEKLFGNWFGWIIPFGNGIARVGFGTDKEGNLQDIFSEFLKRTPLLASARLLSKPVAWIIPIGFPGEVARPGVLLAGDSALQVKPFSGGGLFTGMLGGEIAGRVISEGILKNDMQNIPKRYEEETNKKIYGIVKRGMLLRKIYKSMSEKDKELFLRSLDRDDAKKVIVEAGDIDAPFFTGIKLLKFLGKPLMHYFADITGVLK